MTALVLPWVAGAFAVALLLALYRLLRGPDGTDRILALDTMYVNGMALVVLFGIAQDDRVYFEAALVIALLGFAGTVALAKFLARHVDAGGDASPRPSAPDGPAPSGDATGTMRAGARHGEDG